MNKREVIESLTNEWIDLETAKQAASKVETQAKANFYKEPNYGTGAAWHSAYGDYIDAVKASQMAWIRLEIKRTVESVR